MKTGIFINARLKSTRLPRKHLLEVNGKPIITYLIDRIRHINKKIPIIIVSGCFEENQPFENIACTYFGDDINIPHRQLEAMENFYLDACVSVDGDDILCSPEQIKYIIKELEIAESVKGTGLPFGMNAFGYRYDFLKEQIKTGQQDTNWTEGFDFSLVWNHALTHNNKIRMTLDYPEDYEFFNTLIMRMGSIITEATDEEIIDQVERFKMYEINRGRR